MIWTAAFAAIALVGAGIAMRAPSRSWRLAGLAYALGGVGYGTWHVIRLTDAYGPPFDSAALDIANWFGGAGFLALGAALPLTLTAMGRKARRRFLVVFAALTLTIGVYQFWTSNWAARTASASDRCYATGHYGPGRVERMPPGVRCGDATGEVFVPADAICWLALGGWSVYYAFLASFPLMALVWSLRRRPILRPA